jgi:protein-tyrosine kinase
MSFFRRLTGKQTSDDQYEFDGESEQNGRYRSHRKGRAGWVSPTYSQSATAILDPVTIAENKCVTLLPDMRENEFYRMLRTRILRKTKETGCVTIMVTSARPGEGKTLTSINLAFSFGRDYRRTALLVDCDLRNQSIYRYLGTPGDKGIVDYLLGDVELNDLIVWPSVEKVTLISGGSGYSESTELIGSPKMRELVEEMKSRYPERYVFFDLPPVLSCADAAAFAPLVDWIIVVVRSGVTAISDVNKTLELLPQEKVLGLVLNGQANLEWTYGGRYRTGYPYPYGY